MIEKFIDKRWMPATFNLLTDCSKIIESYQAQNITLTLRQLYYRLVATDRIPNKTTEYNRLSRIIKDGRMCGEIDWDAIEDRIRVPQKHSEFGNIEDLVEAAIYSYRLDRWEGQDHYIELWIEKDALSSVLKPITDKYHITLMVNRGYSSATAMYDASKRFQDNNNEECTILYLGDFDPSGEDMVRDIRDREEAFEADVTIEKIALNKDQIEQYNPPSNPAKMTDPRAKAFVAEHGATSWEVDALEPKVLRKLVEDAILERIDMENYADIIKLEEIDKKALKEFARKHLKKRA